MTSPLSATLTGAPARASRIGRRAGALLSLLALVACRRPEPPEPTPPSASSVGASPSEKPSAAPPPAPSPGPAPAAGAAAGKVVGEAGIAAWDALGAAEKNKLRSTPLVYLHQSVGQDLEDGAEALGVKLEYYGKDAAHPASPSGGLFNDVGPIDNGKPLEKLALVEAIAKRHQGKLKVLAFSFGYADVRDADLARVQAEYARVAAAVKKTGAVMVHVTPPLVFDVAENPPKMKMRSWMLSTFAADPIFDLQDVESREGAARCERGGVWRICPSVRSTAACPSKSQGVDNDGQGHLCEKKAAVLAKAMLYTFALAAR